MKKILFAVLLAFPSIPAHAFEGILHEKITSTHVNGTANIYVSKSGFRQEMAMESVQMPMNMVMVMNTKNSGKVYMLNDKAKTYSELDVAAARKTAKIPDEKFTIKPLGKLTVAGLSCQNVLITSPRMGEMEWCATKELGDAAEFEKFRSSDPHNKTSESLLKALKDAGADGFPIRNVHRGSRSGGDSLTMELVSVEKKTLSTSLFDVPAGYTKQAGFGSGMSGGALPPDAQKQMEEQMKNLSPEQQEQIRKMMKGEN